MAIAKKEKYFEAVGKRKTSIARVRITPASKTEITINGKPANEYFKTKEHQALLTKALAVSKTGNKFKVSVKVSGGGVASQADAVKYGIAKALVKSDESLKPLLKKEKLLTRDARIKERRKFGLKKARKAPQWSKR